MAGALKRCDARGATAWRGRSTDESTDESTTDEVHWTQVPAPPRGHVHVVAYLPHQCLQSRRNPIRNPISDGAEKRQLHRSYLVHTHTRTHTHTGKHARTHVHTYRQRVRRESSHRGNLHDKPAAATPLLRDNAPIDCYRQRKTSSCWTGGGRQQSTSEKQPHQAHTPPRAFSASFVAGPVLDIADAAPQPTRRLSLRLLRPPPSLSLSSSPSPSLLAAPLLRRATPTTTPTITASHEEWVRRNWPPGRELRAGTTGSDCEARAIACRSYAPVATTAAATAAAAGCAADVERCA